MNYGYNVLFLYIMCILFIFNNNIKVKNVTQYEHLLNIFKNNKFNILKIEHSLYYNHFQMHVIYIIILDII